MRYDNLIWDFDGTLFDTYPMMSHALLGALRGLGHEAPLDEIGRYFKRSRAEVMAHCSAAYGVPLDVLNAAYEAEVARTGPEDAQPYPYVPGFLARFCAAGGRNFVFTHRGPSVRAYLDHYRLTPYFTDIVSSGTAFHRKPNPEGNLHLMRTHGMEPARTLAVGDRELDILAGKNAGIDACLFTEQTAESAADYQIRDFAALDAVVGLG